MWKIKFLWTKSYGEYIFQPYTSWDREHSFYMFGLGLIDIYTEQTTLNVDGYFCIMKVQFQC